MQISGLHHITAICGDAQLNIDFYCKLLGLRLVKVTINFDDPGTYHLYYGDTVGSPGSALTFFAWPNLPRGKAGSTQATMISFSVPPGSLDWWKKRLIGGNLPVEELTGALRFQDPDGIALELFEVEDTRQAWLDGGVPAEYAVTGFDSVSLSVGRVEASVQLLQNMGFEPSEAEGENQNMRIGEGQPGQKVRLISSTQRGAPGVGTIHHVAFATASEATQAECAKELVEIGVQPTSVQERQYFKSVYYRESSGVLYEIATDGPGFLIDEPVENLAGRLCIPPWYEKFRGQIEEGLPKIVTPKGIHIPA